MNDVLDEQIAKNIASKTQTERDDLLFKVLRQQEKSRLKHLPVKRAYNHRRRANPEVKAKDVQGANKCTIKRYHEDEAYREKVKADNRRRYAEKQARKRAEKEFTMTSDTSQEASAGACQNVEVEVL